MKIFEKEIRMNRLLEKLKTGLVSKNDFDYYEAFSLMDLNNEGSVDPDAMQCFIKKHKQTVTEEEILSIFRRINFDSDARIKFKEFFDFLKPMESEEVFGNLIYYKTENSIGGRSRDFKKNMRRSTNLSRTRFASEDRKPFSTKANSKDMNPPRNSRDVKSIRKSYNATTQNTQTYVKPLKRSINFEEKIVKSPDKMNTTQMSLERSILNDTITTEKLGRLSTLKNDKYSIKGDHNSSIFIEALNESPTKMMFLNNEDSNILNQ